MTESAHVRGQVWRPDGRAATGAVVTLTDPRGTQVGSASTGENGAFAVALPRDGRYLLVVAAPGHDPWVRYVTAAGADVEMPVVLTDPAGGTTSFSAFGSEPYATERTQRPAPQAPPVPPAPQPVRPEPPYPGFSVPPEPPATHVASTPPQGFAPSERHTSRPYVAEPFAAEPFAAEPFAAEPFGTEPYRAEPFGTEPYRAEPFAAEPFAADPFAAGSFAAGAAQVGASPVEPDLSRRQDETLAVAAQAALNAIAEGRPLPAQSLYGLVTALLASRIELETDPSSALARTAARIGATRGGSLPESRDAADAILAPLARQLLTDDPNGGGREDAADPENVIALLRPLIEALAADLEARTSR